MTLLDNPLVAEFRFPAQIPPLPGHTEGSDPVARATYARQIPGGLHLDGVTEGGIRVRIGLTLVAPGVARVELEPESRLSDGTRARASLARRPATQPSATVEQAIPGQALRGGLSMSACGHAFWRHDIGGFHGQPTPDLYVRWAQFGLLSPLARLHGTTSRLPWDYGAEAAAAFRQAVRLRYRLLPYIYSEAVEAAQTGQPIMRALSLAYPRDPALATLDLEYLFGPDLLVAPIYDPTGKRAVVFPPGVWVDFWTNELIAGPHTREIAVPLEHVPLFVRANSLLPTMEPVERLTEEPWELVVFDCYLLDRAGTTLHDVDGETDASASIDGASLRLELSGSKKRAGLRVYPLAQRAIESVHLNGQPLERRESLTLQAGSLPGWTVESDGTLIAFSG